MEIKVCEADLINAVKSVLRDSDYLTFFTLKTGRSFFVEIKPKNDFLEYVVGSRMFFGYIGDENGVMEVDIDRLSMDLRNMKKVCKEMEENCMKLVRRLKEMLVEGEK